MNCKQCQSPFEVTDADRQFYARFDVPDPQKCPACRDQNRIVFRNEARFYRRDCGLCGQSCMSVYSKDKPFTVYCLKCWWSDRYNPLAYGRDFDFSRPFFEQFYELARVVPKPAIMNMNSENCDYTNYSTENRNCYLVTGSLRSEDCYYSDRLFYCKNVLDSYDLHKCELCYECIQCTQCYGCRYAESCDNCSNCTLCYECTGCQDCFGCINLKNKQYHIFNQPFSKEEYEKRVADLKSNPEGAMSQFKQLQSSVPYRAVHHLNSENCTGDHLVNCKNCRDCYTLKNSEECRFISIGEGNRFCFDCNTCDNAELQYNSANLEQNYDVMGGNLVWYTKNARYITNCFNSNDVFGSIGLKKNQYCVLNKQYDKKTYESLISRVVAHMKKSGEWGEYYPVAHSPFAYNETIAQEHWPLAKEEVLKRGWKWKDPDDALPEVTRLIPAEKLPSSIADIPDDILNWAIQCESTGRPFKIIAQELRFYRENGLSVPRFHPEERHRLRYARRLPRRLFSRECFQCHAPVLTSYSAERPEKVYCEACYLGAVY